MCGSNRCTTRKNGASRSTSQASTRSTTLVGPPQSRVSGRREIVVVEAAIHSEPRAEKSIVDDRTRGEPGRARRFGQGGQRRVELTELAAIGRTAVGSAGERAGQMPGRKLPGEHRANSRQRPGRCAERPVEDGAAVSPRVQMRTGRSIVAVDAEMIGAQRVHDDQEDGGCGCFGCGLAAGPDQRQPDQREPRPVPRAHGAAPEEAAGWCL